VARLLPAKQTAHVCVVGGAEKGISFSVHKYLLLSCTREPAGAAVVFVWKGLLWLCHLTWCKTSLRISSNFVGSKLYTSPKKASNLDLNGTGLLRVLLSSSAGKAYSWGKIAVSCFFYPQSFVTGPHPVEQQPQIRAKLSLLLAR